MDEGTQPTTTPTEGGQPTTPPAEGGNWEQPAAPTPGTETTPPAGDAPAGEEKKW